MAEKLLAAITGGLPLLTLSLWGMDVSLPRDQWILGRPSGPVHNVGHEGPLTISNKAKVVFEMNQGTLTPEQRSSS